MSKPAADLFKNQIFHSQLNPKSWFLKLGAFSIGDSIFPPGPPKKTPLFQPNTKTSHSLECFMSPTIWPCSSRNEGKTSAIAPSCFLANPYEKQKNTSHQHYVTEDERLIYQHKLQAGRVFSAPESNGCLWYHFALSFPSNWLKGGNPEKNPARPCKGNV